MIYCILKTPDFEIRLDNDSDYNSPSIMRGCLGDVIARAIKAYDAALPCNEPYRDDSLAKTVKYYLDKD